MGWVRKDSCGAKTDWLPPLPFIDGPGRADTVSAHADGPDCALFDCDLPPKDELDAIVEGMWPLEEPTASFTSPDAEDTILDVIDCSAVGELSNLEPSSLDSLALPFPVAERFSGAPVDVDDILDYSDSSSGWAR